MNNSKKATKIQFADNLKMKNKESVKYNSGKFRQFLVAVIVNLLSFSSGISWGWPSPVIPQLRSSQPPIGQTPLSEAQISWIGGLMAIGGFMTVLFCGILTETIGRKNFAILTGLPHMASWLLIIFGTNYLYIYAARLAAGMAAGMTLFIVPLYVSEIASTDIRGSLGSILVFAVNSGVLFAYVTGIFLPYRVFACFSMLFSLFFVVIFAFMPETPVYLIRQNKQVQAYKSLKFLRGENQAIEEELACLEYQTKASNSSSKKIQLSDLLKDRATRKGLIIAFGLLAAQQLSGIFAMTSYAETIFQRAGSTLSAEASSIIVSSIQMLSSCISTITIDRIGRRPLALVSCVGMAISHCFVGLFFYLHQNHFDVSSISWLPVVALSAYIVHYCLGIGPISIVILSEIFNLDFGSFAVTVCFIFYWIISFVAIQVFGMVTQILGAHVCFFMLASFCVTSFVFTYCLMPETMGRDRQEILNELAGRRATDKQICDSDNKLKRQDV